MSTLTSVAELPRHEDAWGDLASYPVLWDVAENPNIDNRAVHVDVARTTRLLKTAGFCGVHIRQFIAEDDAESQLPPIGTANEDGTVAAGYAYAIPSIGQPAAKLSLQYQANQQGLSPDHQWPRLVIDVDRQSAGSLMSDYRQAGASHEMAFSKVYDTAVRRGVQLSAYERNLFSNPRAILGSTLVTVWGASDVLNGFESTDGLGVWAACQGIGLVSSLIGNIRRTGDTALLSRRWSFSALPGIVQPDRAIAAGLISQFGGRLITAANK